MKSLKETALSSLWGVYREYKLNRNQGLRTGLAALDNYLMGLGGLVNIQGETGSCKSSLGLQIAHHGLMTRGRPCIIIDKENGVGRLFDRILCQMTNKSLEEYNNLSEGEIKKNEVRADKYPLHIHTESVESPQVFEEFVATIWEMYKKPFTILFDSIQAADDLGDDQRVSLETWVKLLDKIKLTYSNRVCIIFVCEKGRAAYGTQGVGGGKGSNVVDYKPETVLDIKYDEDEDKFSLKVSKHRDGIKGRIFTLRKVMTSNDPRSFCYKLKESDE